MPDLRDHVALLRDSLFHVTGRDLLDYPGADADPEEAAYEAPFALLSHDTREDPIFVYGNRTALRLFELDWNAFIALPSRLSAEPLARDERVLGGGKQQHDLFDRLPARVLSVHRHVHAQRPSGNS